jgi:hypothetical protein
MSSPGHRCDPAYGSIIPNLKLRTSIPSGCWTQAAALGDLPQSRNVSLCPQLASEMTSSTGKKMSRAARNEPRCIYREESRRVRSPACRAASNPAGPSLDAAQHPLLPSSWERTREAERLSAPTAPRRISENADDGSVSGPMARPPASSSMSGKKRGSNAHPDGRPHDRVRSCDAPARSYGLFEMSPFARHSDRFHAPGERQNSPRLD